MTSTFNGIPIEQVFAMKISPRRPVLRVLDSRYPELEQQFALKYNASVKVSIDEVESKLVRYKPCRT
jgi:hypothetical protein